MDEGQRLFDDGFTASVTIILNGVNAFMYQVMLLPLYFQIAMQKTVLCTANDVFALFDATGTKIRLGRPDLQKASDMSSGVCVSNFLASKLDALMEKTSQNDVTSAANQLARSSSSAAASVFVGSTAGIGSMGKKSTEILQLMNGNRPFSAERVATSIKNAASNAGQKMKPMMDKINNNKLVSRIGSLMGRMQLGTQIHLIDSIITYAIGVVSGMADMAQVLDQIFLHIFIQSPNLSSYFYSSQIPLFGQTFQSVVLAGGALATNTTMLGSLSSILHRNGFVLKAQPPLRCFKCASMGTMRESSAHIDFRRTITNSGDLAPSPSSTISMQRSMISCFLCRLT